MRSKMLWIVLLLLSFNILHDSFMVMLEQNRYANAVHSSGSDASAQESADLNDIHEIFHLMAIIAPEKTGWIHFQKENTLTPDPHHYSPPPAESAHKPPIV